MKFTKIYLVVYDNVTWRLQKHTLSCMSTWLELYENRPLTLWKPPFDFMKTSLWLYENTSLTLWNLPLNQPDLNFFRKHDLIFYENMPWCESQHTLKLTKTCLDVYVNMTWIVIGSTYLSTWEKTNI